MVDLRKLRELDLSELDAKRLTPEQWEAVKREGIRRAHAERASMMRALFVLPRVRWLRRKRAISMLQTCARWCGR